MTDLLPPFDLKQRQWVWKVGQKTLMLQVLQPGSKGVPCQIDRLGTSIGQSERGGRNVPGGEKLRPGIEIPFQELG